MNSIISLALALASQVDPNSGTAKAQAGAVQRLTEPNIYDIAFPFIAFVLVILVPTVTAIWVIAKTVREKQGEADET